MAARAGRVVFLRGGVLVAPRGEWEEGRVWWWSVVVVVVVVVGVRARARGGFVAVVDGVVVTALRRARDMLALILRVVGGRGGQCVDCWKRCVVTLTGMQ